MRSRASAAFSACAICTPSGRGRTDAQERIEERGSATKGEGGEIALKRLRFGRRRESNSKGIHYLAIALPTADENADETRGRVSTSRRDRRPLGARALLWLSVDAPAAHSIGLPSLRLIRFSEKGVVAGACLPRLQLVIMPHDPEVEELVLTLQQMASLLRSSGDVTRWAGELDRCREIIENSDFYGVRRLLGLYGGMGSLNDVVLQHKGVILTEENERFAALREKTWSIAQQLRREVDR